MRIYLVMSALVAALFVGVAGPSLAQDAQTLADIRQELVVLNTEVQNLKRELSTTGGASVPAAGSSALERIDGIEAALQKLTAKSEQLEFRIKQVVKDGTNRIGDLEFRLVELEGGDVSALGETSTLGGGETPAVATPTPSTDTTGGAQLAVGEEADFKAAQASLVEGDYATAAQLFMEFNQTYPGGPMAAQAHLGRGQAMEGSGTLTEAARAYLEAFSAAPKGKVAPDALFHLGRALGRLGQTSEACVTLAEVETRFPQSKAVLDANSAMRNLGCS